MPLALPGDEAAGWLGGDRAFRGGGGGSGKEGKGRLEDRRDILRDSIWYQNSDQPSLSGDGGAGICGKPQGGGARRVRAPVLRLFLCPVFVGRRAQALCSIMRGNRVG